MKIKDYLKSKLPEAEYESWIEPITEQIKTDGQTVLLVPNVFFENEISKMLTEHKLEATIEIDERLQKAADEQPEQPFPAKATIEIDERLECPPAYVRLEEQAADEELRRIFNERLEQIVDARMQRVLAKIRPQSNIKTLRMEKPYSKGKVVTSDMINAKFFTYPTSCKTKYGRAETTFKDQEYIVHRGKKTTNPKEEAVGQLDTTHLKILLAIMHTWQEQNCKFLGAQSVIKVSETLKEIAEKIGAIRQHRKWLKQKVDELTKYPITLERKCDGDARSFTYLSEVTTITEGNAKKRTVVLKLHEMLTQELRDREKSNLLRNKECYRIKNPASLKFLLTYDRRIYASKEGFILQIEDIARELELRGEKKDIIKAIKKIIKNLNGYKITNDVEIRLELEKEGKERYLLVGKREYKPRTSSEATKKEGIILKLET
jgi:hypothetical protein